MLYIAKTGLNTHPYVLEKLGKESSSGVSLRARKTKREITRSFIINCNKTCYKYIVNYCSDKMQINYKKKKGNERLFFF